jgi:hypothetical protein
VNDGPRPQCLCSLYTFLLNHISKFMYGLEFKVRHGYHFAYDGDYQSISFSEYDPSCIFISWKDNTFLRLKIWK